MNKIIVVVLLSLAPFMAHAEEESGTWTSVTASYLNQYVDEDGIVLHDQPVAQFEAFHVTESGLWVGGFYSAGIDGTDGSSDYGDEVNYMAGWYHEFGSFSLDIAMVYFDLYPIDGAGKGDLWGPYIQVDYTAVETENFTIEPFVRVDSYVARANEDIPEGGTRTRVGIRTETNESNFFIRCRVSYLYEDGAFGLESSNIVQFDLMMGPKRGSLAFLPTISAFYPMTDHNEEVPQIVGGMTVLFDSDL